MPEQQQVKVHFLSEMETVPEVLPALPGQPNNPMPHHVRCRFRLVGIVPLPGNQTMLVDAADVDIRMNLGVQDIGNEMFKHLSNRLKAAQIVTGDEKRIQLAHEMPDRRVLNLLNGKKP